MEQTSERYLNPTSLIDPLMLMTEEEAGWVEEVRNRVEKSKKDSVPFEAGVHIVSIIDLYRDK